MKLMLAEDEPGLSRALTAILQHSDYEVDTALDGLTALEYLLANDYDAAILDIMMPGMDGIEVLKRTREAGKRLPIIMLTAKSEVSDKVEGLDAGANDYLTKPFAAKELLARIRAMTRAATAIDATLPAWAMCASTRRLARLSVPWVRSTWPIVSFSLWSSLCATPARVCPPNV